MTGVCACGDGPAGVRGCAEPMAVWVEFTDRNGYELAAMLCHRHAAELRSGTDPWDEGEYAALPYTVTGWRSA